jgi:hypothetical protein
MTHSSAEQKNRFIASANREGRGRAVQDVVRAVPFVASLGVAAIGLDGSAVDVPIAAVGLA